VNWLKPHRPSPALVIALIALFVAMGGTGYAALKLPRNSVGTKQLKKNAVTGSKVKNGSLTGKDIKLKSLGAVPTATNATNAAQALHAAAADTAASADELKSFKHFTLTVGPNAPAGQNIVTIGPFTLNAFCEINNANNDTAQLRLITTEAGSALDGSPETNNLPTGTPNEFRTSTSTPTGTTNIEFSSVSSGAIAPDGTEFWGFFPVHVNPPGKPGKCEFKGFYTSTL